ncbi:Ribosomal_protein P1B [Hexamita inflata]|uniref:Ribosomal protein P1B n=1 Tax=Hexamita inflata TaxID=28002 RepID=A0AA86VNK3_9EUKA|nr:Ribosomal protein P1B [Hexamita inflata]CAI9971473.1 Ribosomal protein P1B [Hexamita inflata]CAI9972403.1 Ribosomal protein P1B [Hexamita inflata]
MNSELACVLSAIILADTKQEITADAILKIAKAANVEVKPQWPILFAQFLGGKDMIELLTSIGSGSAAPAAAAGAVAVVEEKKEKTEEEQIVAGFAFGDSSSSEEESS